MKRSESPIPLLLVIVVILSASMVWMSSSADDSKSTPAALTTIQVKGDDATRIKDAYNALVSANREMQFAILQARYVNNVPKEWEFDLTNFSFKPPTPQVTTGNPTILLSNPPQSPKESKP